MGQQMRKIFDPCKYPLFKHISVGLCILFALAFASPLKGQAIYHPDCNDPDAKDLNCTELTADLIAEARQSGYPYYLGHAEPTALFYYTKGASGYNMQWKFRIPSTDPTPTQSGSSVANFELFEVFWIGLDLCDPNSSPFGACTPLSDTNNPATAGSAVLELQFFPPGFSNCTDTSKWCVLLHINTFENATTFQNMNCKEPTTAAFVTLDGTPGGTQLKMANGDSIEVTISDTANGLEAFVNDVTSSSTGFMVASGANGFKHNANGIASLNNTATDCSTTAFDFHAAYATASPGQGSGWAALRLNVGFDFEIGHWELCSDSSCSSPPVENHNGVQTADTNCGTIQGVAGCLDSELDHDGTSYLADWPDGSSAHPASLVLGSPDDKGVGPLTSSTSNTSNFNQGYPVITFKTTEATNGAFYPFFTQAGTSPCVFNFGNDIPGVTTNDFGKATQYGTTIVNPCLPGSAPQLSLPGPLSLTACLGSTATTTLNICNVGKGDLTINSISSSDSQLSVSTPSSGYPLDISPDSCFPFQVNFTPSAPGSSTATLTISSDDPNTPTSMLTVTENSPPPIINTTIANSGSFGNICAGNQGDLTLQVLNQGQCNLNVSNITSSNSAFILPAGTMFPLVLSADASVNVPIRFTPSGVCSNTIPQSSTITITSNDPAHATIIQPVSGIEGCPKLVLSPQNLTGTFAFPATVSDPTGTLGCYTDRKITVSNSGICPLNISSLTTANGVDGSGLALPGAPLEFQVVNPTVPFSIAPGAATVPITVRFRPTILTDQKSQAPDQQTGTLNIVSNDPAAADNMAGLCGEPAFHSGARVLVINSLSSPVSSVEDLSLSSKGLTPPFSERLKPAPLNTAPNICGNTILYHLDNETLRPVGTTGSNPLSSYDLSAKNGSAHANMSFTLNQCQLQQIILQIK